MEILGMTVNEFLIVVSIILIVVDIFFASDFPTHLAYIIVTFTIAKEIDMPILYQILFGLLIWFALVIFHYTLWRKVIEKINDEIHQFETDKDKITIGNKYIVLNIKSNKLII